LCCTPSTSATQPKSQAWPTVLDTDQCNGQGTSSPCHVAPESRASASLPRPSTQTLASQIALCNKCVDVAQRNRKCRSEGCANEERALGMDGGRERGGRGRADRECEGSRVRKAGITESAEMGGTRRKLPLALSQHASPGANLMGLSFSLKTPEMTSAESPRTSHANNVAEKRTIQSGEHGRPERICLRNLAKILVPLQLEYVLRCDPIRLCLIEPVQVLLIGDVAPRNLSSNVAMNQ
jgi:hypothetical protein